MWTSQEARHRQPLGLMRSDDERVYHEETVGPEDAARIRLAGRARWIARDLLRRGDGPGSLGFRTDMDALVLSSEIIDPIGSLVPFPRQTA